MYSMTNNKLTATLGAALFATIACTSAWAGDATLMPNERAAQYAIVETAQSRPMFNDESAATLAHNESAAQRIFVDPTVSTPARTSIAMNEAALSHNESAAQRAIAETSVGEKATIRRISASFGAAPSPDGRGPALSESQRTPRR